LDFGLSALDFMGARVPLLGGPPPGYDAGEEDGMEDPIALQVPWDTKPSLFEFLRERQGPAKKLEDSGTDLPDQARQSTGAGFRWAAGAKDGIGTHHMSGGQDEEAAEKVFLAVEAACGAPTIGNLRVLYDLLVPDGFLGIVDAFLKRVFASDTCPPARLSPLALWLARETPDRGPVKCGIALLGLFRPTEESLEALMTLGRHDEFTLFSAVALQNVLDDATDALWDLGRSTTGWGRIHAVERLAGTERKDIRGWLLREGHRNSIMAEYTACACAEGGGLLAALRTDPVDDEVLEAAAEILRALACRDGPAKTIADYADGAPVAQRFTELVEARPGSLSCLLATARLRDFLGDDSPGRAAPGAAGWEESVRTDVAARCRRIMADPSWKEVVSRALEKVENRSLAPGGEAAGIDLWEEAYRRLEEGERKWLEAIRKGLDEGSKAGA
jgi:hypothetical protein